MELRERARKIMNVLKKAYPDARCMLHHRNAYELLVATILAAQCTDQKVNEVTASLFKKYRTPADLAAAETSVLEKEVKSTGFFRQKTKSIRNCCAIIIRDYDGKVPGTMEEMLKLPGVGRKTANVVLGECFGKPGIIVDTHFRRVTARLGLTRNEDPDKIEADLDELIPLKDRTLFSHVITFHGRRICVARKPRCEECPVNSLCDYYTTQGSQRNL